MYALERSTPELVAALLRHGARTFELEWSDNNELKSALRNPQHASAMVALVLELLEPEQAEEMITSDWDDHDCAEGQAQSAWQMAQSCPDPACLELLQRYVASLKDPTR
jgi:hypothetical protein